MPFLTLKRSPSLILSLWAERRDFSDYFNKERGKPPIMAQNESKIVRKSLLFDIFCKQSDEETEKIDQNENSLKSASKTNEKNYNATVLIHICEQFGAHMTTLITDGGFLSLMSVPSNC
jgi:hypothetical protein